MTMPDPGWHPDPAGRHQYRWWDGASWTDDVADDGVAAVDPVAGQAATTPDAAAPDAAAPDAAGPVGPGPEAPGDAAAGTPGEPAPYPPASYPPIDQAPTAEHDATVAYGQPPGAGWSPGPGAPPPGTYGGQPYDVGGVPPEPPGRSGPPVALIVAGAVVVLAIIAGLAIALTRDGGDDTSTGDATETSDGGTTATSPTTATSATGGTGQGQQESSVFDLSVGDCVSDDADVTGEVESVMIVDCSRPHTLEVFHSHQIQGQSLPDQAGIEQLVRDQCLPAFESFVGISLGSSSLLVNYYSPTADSWDAGDRELLCLVTDPAGEITGSLAGANR